MAVNATQHRIAIDELDETNEGGPHQYMWACSCRRNGRWTEDKDAARRGGDNHVSRFAPKAKVSNRTRLMRSAGLTLTF